MQIQAYHTPRRLLLFQQLQPGNRIREPEWAHAPACIDQRCDEYRPEVL
jgi:hypothetical protein